jgi:thiamine-monophosphate kinase
LKKALSKLSRNYGNKVSTILHQTSKAIVERCKAKGYGIIYEDLKGLRKTVNKKVKRFNRFNGKVQLVSKHSKKLKRRLNNWWFRKFLNQISSKCVWEEVKAIESKHTWGSSSTCPICGSRLTKYPNGFVECEKHGLMDRHAVACLNLLRWEAAVQPRPPLRCSREPRPNEAYKPMRRSVESQRGEVESLTDESTPRRNTEGFNRTLNHFIRLDSLGWMALKTVGEVGERKLVERILKLLTPMPLNPLPPWEDASAIDLGGGFIAVLKTDMLVWRTDVPPGMQPRDVGWKVVVMNFSDLAAKGAKPKAFLASIGVPRDTSVITVDEIIRGMDEASRHYDTYFLGGDTNEASEIIVAGVAFGVGERKKLMKRSGARPGDILAVTGAFGDTAASFKILLEDYDAPEGLKERLLRSVYIPRARVREGAALAETRVVTASIDSSDGLAMSLHDLSRSSGVGFRVERMPISGNAARFAQLHDLDPWELALYGGEEYELVFTVSPEGIEKVKKTLRSVGCTLLNIGVATEERRLIYLDEGMEKPIRRGWEHFKGVSLHPTSTEGQP